MGIARAAIDELIDLATRKKPSYSRIPLHDREMAQHHVAKAQALVDALPQEDEDPSELEEGGVRVAIVGRPNVGKSTLFKINR